MIRAFAMRTASALGDGFVGRCVSAPAVGSMLNCVGAIEPCWRGCTFIGPVRVDLLFGITDNALLSSSFDGLCEKGVGRISDRVARTRARCVIRHAMRGWTKIHPPSKLPTRTARVRR